MWYHNIFVCLFVFFHCFVLSHPQAPAIPCCLHFHEGKTLFLPDASAYRAHFVSLLLSQKTLIQLSSTSNDVLSPMPPLFCLENLGIPSFALPKHVGLFWISNTCHEVFSLFPPGPSHCCVVVVSFSCSTRYLRLSDINQKHLFLPSLEVGKFKIEVPADWSVKAWLPCFHMAVFSLCLHMALRKNYLSHASSEKGTKSIHEGSILMTCLLPKGSISKYHHIRDYSFNI